MGKHSITVSSQGQPIGAGTALSGTRSIVKPVPQSRKRPAMIAPLIASFATAALVLVIVVDPYSGTYASAAPPAQWEENVETQTVVVADSATVAITRESYSITEPPPPVVVAAVPAPATASTGTAAKSAAAAPAAGTPDPGSAKAVAQAMVAARGWDSSQYNCLVSLWNKESGWNMYASNKSSGAYGIPQALPGSKMASAGSDWATNAATQISWGLGYIAGRYSTPCGAWTHSQAIGWY